MKIHLALILVIIVLLLNKNNNVESMDCINCNKIYKNQDKACVNKFSNTCKNFKQKKSCKLWRCMSQQGCFKNGSIHNHKNIFKWIDLQEPPQCYLDRGFRLRRSKNLKPLVEEQIEDMYSYFLFYKPKPKYPLDLKPKPKYP